MTLPQTLRREILHILDEKIIPATARATPLPSFLAQFPFHLPPQTVVHHLPIRPLPDTVPVPTFGQIWKKAHVNNFHVPCLAFVAEGEADLRIGVTRSMTQQAAETSAWTRSGCHILEVGAPFFAYFPAGAPYAQGVLHWERSTQAPSRIVILWVHVFSARLLCHLCICENGKHRARQSLIVDDAQLTELVALLEGEMAQREAHFEEVAAALLRAFMVRLQRHFKYRPPLVANSVWLPERELLHDAPNASPQAQRIVQMADDFILFRLNEPLLLPDIAAHCGVSPAHLNRLFNEVTGMSAKRYVSRQRIRAACAMLVESDWPIKEVARLLGFSQTTHFCQVFARAEQMSPLQFRRTHRQRERERPKR